MNIVRPAHERTPARPVYPFSVIRGGAYNRDELVHALAADPVAARHYAGFGAARARVVAASAHSAYVSYRRADRIVWTRRPVALARGEPLLTDGASTARARCGNRISALPMEPSEAETPLEVVSPGLYLEENALAPFLPGPELVAEIFPSGVAALMNASGNPLPRLGIARLPGGETLASAHPYGRLSPGGGALPVSLDLPGAGPPWTAPPAPPDPELASGPLLPEGASWQAEPAVGSPSPAQMAPPPVPAAEVDSPSTSGGWQLVVWPMLQGFGDLPAGTPDLPPPDTPDRPLSFLRPGDGSPTPQPSSLPNAVPEPSLWPAVAIVLATVLLARLRPSAVPPPPRRRRQRR